MAGSMNPDTTFIIHCKSQVAMTLREIDGGWAQPRATEFARRGPWGGLLCAVWKLNKTTEAGSQGSNTPMGPWPGEFHMDRRER